MLNQKPHPTPPAHPPPATRSYNKKSTKCYNGLHKSLQCRRCLHLARTWTCTSAGTSNIWSCTVLGAQQNHAEGVHSEPLLLSFLYHWSGSGAQWGKWHQDQIVAIIANACKNAARSYDKERTHLLQIYTCFVANADNIYVRLGCLITNSFEKKETSKERSKPHSLQPIMVPQ